MTERQARRRPRASAADTAPDRSAAYRQLVNPFEPLEVLSTDRVEHIHHCALSILEELGMKVLLPQARQVFEAAGATVDEQEQLVRIDRGLVAQALSTAPPVFDLRATVPARNLRVGGQHVAFLPVAGPPNATDLQRGRRMGTLQDFEDFVRLSQHFDVIHALAPSVEPQDVGPEFRHLQVTLAQLGLSDKVPFVYSRGTPQVQDCFELIRMAHGISHEAFRAAAYCYTNINTNSPRQLDIPMAQGILDFAAAGQMLIITPFTLAGAMAPVTLAGALTLAHAEALAGITLAQIVRPGTPVVYGAFTSNVDMKSGSPAFGTPEYAKACLGAGQLARHIGLPWRSSNATASSVVDEQATYESAMSLWGAVMGGCNVLVHSAGWLEGGLSASFEKFILDVEQLQMMAEFLAPLDASDAEIGLDSIREVPPGGHFFATAHTMQRYRCAFYAPLVSDWSNFGQWQAAGSRTAVQRATDIWQRILREHRFAPHDPDRLEAMKGFVERRQAEGGALPVS
ncbi:MAG: trimethylamine methyltransferase family protein [Steroidobacteraceae bacterium]